MFSDPSKNVAILGVDHGMKVVDLGAGSGYYSIESAKRVGPSGRVYAVDVQQDMLAKLKNTAATAGIRNIEVVWGNVEKLGGTKLREGVADRTILSNTLFQIPEKERDNLALEIKRITRPGGKLMVIDWEAGSPMTPKTVVPTMVAQALFQKAGFELERTFDAGDHHYGILFKRI